MRVMSTNPSFLQSSVDREVKNLRDWGIPLGRRFRALKLWFVIREQGVSGLQKRLRRDMANARHLAKLIAATPGWRVVAPVNLQTVCVRHHPLAPDGSALGGEALDEHTTAWVETVNRSGAAYLTPASLTVAGWRGCRSAPWRRKPRTSKRSGRPCGRRRRPARSRPGRSAARRGVDFPGRTETGFQRRFSLVKVLLWAQSQALYGAARTGRTFEVCILESSTNGSKPL